MVLGFGDFGNFGFVVSRVSWVLFDVCWVCGLAGFVIIGVGCDLF